MGTFCDLTGERFGKLTVLSVAGQKKNHETLWLCRCDCGNEHVFGIGKLKNGTRYQCPECSLKGRSLKNMKYENNDIKHGRLYSAWSGMKGRCSGLEIGKAALKNKKCYFDRGIKVCEEWQDFTNFRNDMEESFNEALALYKDEPFSLDRIDNNKGYFKENCRWASYKQQARNRRFNKEITYEGAHYGTIAEMCETLGFDYGKFRHRYNFMMNELMKEFQDKKEIENGCRN